MSKKLICRYYRKGDNICIARPISPTGEKQKCLIFKDKGQCFIQLPPKYLMPKTRKNKKRDKPITQE